VEVTYLAYRGTMQATALSLVARKLRSALQLEGDTIEAGLAATHADDDSLLAMLSRALRTGQRLDDAEHLFADLRRVEVDTHQELIAVSDLPVFDAPIVWPPGTAAPVELPATVIPCPDGEAITPAHPAPVSQTQLVLGSLADLARPGAQARHRPSPGQLSFIDLLTTAPALAAPPEAAADDQRTGEARQLPLWTS
jgi:hypothetical protein